jgi:type VI protein secretion system component Hcp
MAKKSKAKARKHVATKDLTSRDAKSVKGGGTVTARKAGKGQQEYLIVKMNDVLISGV